MHFEALCTSMLVSYDIFFGILFYSRLEMIMMCCSTLSHCLPFWCAIKLPNLMPVYSEWRRATRTRILHPLGFWTLVIPHPLNPVCAKTRLRCARHCPSSYCVATLFFLPFKTNFGWTTPKRLGADQNSFWSTLRRAPGKVCGICGPVRVVLATHCGSCVTIRWPLWVQLSLEIWGQVKT